MKLQKIAIFVQKTEKNMLKIKIAYVPSICNLKYSVPK